MNILSLDKSRYLMSEFSQLSPFGKIFGKIIISKNKNIHIIMPVKY